MEANREHFDNVIGRLDRLLSEFLLLTEQNVDQADWQTLKHHAGDLIGVGQKALLNLKAEKAPEMTAERMAFLVENPPWS